MEYKNDERYWNIKLLNKWFAISSILFLISIGWMFLHDNDDEFKMYQRNFRKIETQITQNKLNDELDKVVNSRVEFEKKYEKLIMAVGYIFGRFLIVEFISSTALSISSLTK